MSELAQILQAAPHFDRPVELVGPLLPTMAEIAADVAATLASGQLTNDGRFVRELEAAFAQAAAVPYALATANGTLALCLCLAALPEQGEVICPSFTFCATAHSIVWAGCQPVFCDVDENTWGCTAETIAPHITDQTVALMPVHIFGVPCPITQIQSLAAAHGLAVIYDSAQAAGSRYQGTPLGGFGQAECFSLHATKVLAAGEGGMVTTQDRAGARWLRQARNFGLEEGDCSYVGLNAKLAEYPAILALQALRRLPQAIEQRRALLTTFRRQVAPLAGLTLQTVPNYAAPNWQNLVVRIDAERWGLTREQLAGCLHALNIDNRAYFYPPLHQLSCYRASARTALPVTEQLCAETLCLPLHGRLTQADMQTVGAALVWLADHAQLLAPLVPRGHSPAPAPALSVPGWAARPRGRVGERQLHHTKSDRQGP